MSFMRDYSSKGGTVCDSFYPSFTLDHGLHKIYHQQGHYGYNYHSQNHGIYSHNYDYSHCTLEMLDGIRSHNNHCDASRTNRERNIGSSYNSSRNSPSYKRRKFSDSNGGDNRRYGYQPTLHANVTSFCSSVPAFTRPSASGQACTTGKRNRTELENDTDSEFVSKEQIERFSPSRKDGIDAVHETRLRYSYCAFLQNLGMRLQLPQTTIGTAMVLCHRFFVRRSHACHDRYLVATAALFLVAKSEETARPLNNLLTASCEIVHGQNMSILTYMFPIGWFEQYRERVLEAEQLILTTLDFELEVQHPFDPLTSILDKVGLSQSMLVNLALSLVSEGLRSSLWLQFKPRHIAAGATYLAARMLNVDSSSCQNIWREFQAPQDVLHEVAEQLKELFF